MSRQLNLNPKHTTPSQSSPCLPPPTIPSLAAMPTGSIKPRPPDNTKPRARRPVRLRLTYMILDVRTQPPVAEQKKQQGSRRRSMRRSPAGTAPHERSGLSAGLTFLLYSFQSVRCTDRASGKAHMHAFAHVHAPSRTHTTHLPPAAHTLLILLPPLMADALCSLLFPFSLSPSAPPFAPFFNILFSSFCTCSRLLHAAPTFLRPLLSPPSLSLSLRPSLPPSLLLTLFSVCRARGHYLSHSGHVRWNGGECSEQKQRELWGIVASSGRLGNSAALSPRENIHAL